MPMSVFYPRLSVCFINKSKYSEFCSLYSEHVFSFSQIRCNSMLDIWDTFNVYKVVLRYMAPSTWNPSCILDCTVEVIHKPLEQGHDRTCPSGRE